MQSFSGARPVVIRPFCQDDTPLLHDAIRESIQQLGEWMTWCSPDHSISHTKSFIHKSAQAWERAEEYCFAIIDAKERILMGGVSLNQISRAHNFANLEYWVRSSRTGSGIASAATLLAVEFGLEDLGYNRLELLIPNGNIPSKRVAQKVGAKFEGVLRNRLFLRGQPRDALMYSVVRGDADDRDLADTAPIRE